MSKIELVARSDANVLLSGETGAGKTTVARAIHFHSRRRKMPFCTVNCGAMPFSLIESELFGHRKGAFTGADENRLGRLRSVGKGTLFLDEIDTLALEAQPKLLRALDTRSFEVVGEDKHQEFMGRIISATNRPLEELAEVGEFRKDLYYRLKVVELSVPPLREHREDISPIANRFLAELANRENSPKKSFTRSAVQRLEDHSWPGNIRELRNAVEQAAVFSPNNVIDVAHFMNLTSPSRNHPTAHARSNGHRVRQASGSDEAELIKELLAKNGNNRSRTAMELGISRAAFYKKLTKYGLVSQQ